MKRAKGGVRSVGLFIDVEGDVCHQVGANNFVSLFVDKWDFIATNTCFLLFVMFVNHR